MLQSLKCPHAEVTKLKPCDYSAASWGLPDIGDMELLFLTFVIQTLSMLLSTHEYQITVEAQPIWIVISEPLSGTINWTLDTNLDCPLQ